MKPYKALFWKQYRGTFGTPKIEVYYTIMHVFVLLYNYIWYDSEIINKIHLGTSNTILIIKTIF